ncbi:unnamed protein product [Durusdinium trenchii]|uniref:C3H1-type domain-containing protein n=1 Tax=Durusdinium trenchii TaxID=1381693 RepID=A0ABP0MY64_9DINO
MDGAQCLDFKGQLSLTTSTYVVKNTFLDVIAEEGSSGDELNTPFTRNVSAPPVMLHEPAYVQTDAFAALGQRLYNGYGVGSTHINTPLFEQIVQLEQPLKSKGSIGHPKTCKECSFYFFSAAGCRSGADCSFCHEIHPRKNKRKNRLIQMRETGTQKEIVPEKVGQDFRSSQMKLDKKLDSAKAEGSQGTSSPFVGSDIVLRVSYYQGAMSEMSDISAPLSLTLVTGEGAR